MGRVHEHSVLPVVFVPLTGPQAADGLGLIFVTPRDVHAVWRILAVSQGGPGCENIS
jgi:hypothetical protein